MRTDTRSLVVGADGLTIAPTAKAKGESLCGLCYLAEHGCSKREYPNAQSCKDMVVPIAFSPPIKGIDGDFSTFRSSSIWYDRAKAIFAANKRVALIDNSTGELICNATVVDAHRGPAAKLLDRFAHTNHLCRANKVLNPEAPGWLRHQIRMKMGQRYIKRDDQISTVIMLRAEPTR